MASRSRVRPALVALALLPALAAAARAEDAAAPPAAAELSPAAFLEGVAPTIVSFKYVLKSANRERQGHALGEVVDGSGLVVLANDYLGSGQTKASDLKITFGNDPKEWEAVVVARDALLGLGWVQVVGLDKPVAATDVGADGGTPVLGQDLRSVMRKGRGFDFAPIVARHYVAAGIEKPRKMWSLSGDSPSLGLAVFDLAGRPMGVMVRQSGSDGDESSGVGAFLLPLSEVRKSLEAAKKRVPEALAKAAEKPKEKPEGEKEKPDGKPDEKGKEAPPEKPSDGGMGDVAPEKPK